MAAEKTREPETHGNNSKQRDIAAPQRHSDCGPRLPFTLWLAAADTKGEGQENNCSSEWPVFCLFLIIRNGQVLGVLSIMGPISPE